MIVGAVYMLRAVRSILHGPLEEKWAGVPDAHLWRKAPFALLLAALLLFGCWPRFLTDKIRPSVDAIISMATAVAPSPPQAALPRSADFQSAVSPIFNRQAPGPSQLNR